MKRDRRGRGILPARHQDSWWHIGAIRGLQGRGNQLTVRTSRYVLGTHTVPLPQPTTRDFTASSETTLRAILSLDESHTARADPDSGSSPHGGCAKDTAALNESPQRLRRRLPRPSPLQTEGVARAAPPFPIMKEGLRAPTRPAELLCLH